MIRPTEADDGSHRPTGNPTNLLHSQERLQAGSDGTEEWAGSSRVIAHPGLPQIRTCAIDAYGSSGYGFAARRYTEWTTTAFGSG